MALVLEKDQFDFRTKKVGRIRIGSNTMRASEEFAVELSKRAKVSSVALVRKLISIIGRRYDDTSGELQSETLDHEIVEAISDEEVDEISRIFIEKNDWLCKDINNPEYEVIESEQGETVNKVSYGKRNIPREESETNSDYLIHLV